MYFGGFVMANVRSSIFALSMWGLLVATAQAANESNEMRGELLYTTQCEACHTTAIHWREKKLAKDWKGLKAQVARWQVMAKLSWTDQDIVDVTLYLNKRYYHFENTELKAVTQVVK
jgi:mono/diheme cytochrome c family protein